MKTPFLLLTLLAVLTTACEKENKSFTQISGQVYEYNNGAPVPFAKVRFEWWNPATFGETRHFVDSTTADAQGNYSLAGDVPNGEEYYVIADAPGYFITEQTEVIRPNVKRGKKQTVNLDLIPYAWVRMNIKKTGLYNTLEINPPPGSNSVRGFVAWSDTILHTRVLGNRNIELIVFKNHSFGNYDIVKYPLQSIGHDTVDISIDF